MYKTLHASLSFLPSWMCIWYSAFLYCVRVCLINAVAPIYPSGTVGYECFMYSGIIVEWLDLWGVWTPSYFNIKPLACVCFHSLNQNVLSSYRLQQRKAEELAAREAGPADPLWWDWAPNGEHLPTVTSEQWGPQNRQLHVVSNNTTTCYTQNGFYESHPQNPYVFHSGSRTQQFL